MRTTHTTGPNFTLPNTDYAHKTSQVISVEHVLILPEDRSQRIRNIPEFLSFKILIHADFNPLSFIHKCTGRPIKV